MTDEQVDAVITKTLEGAPKDSMRWSTRSMAREVGLTQSAVSRIWRAFGLQPHRQDTFKLSKNRAVEVLRELSPADAVRPLRAEFGLSERQARRHVNAALRRPEGVAVPERTAVFTVRLAPSLIGGLRAHGGRDRPDVERGGRRGGARGYLRPIPFQWSYAVKPRPGWPICQL